GRKITLSLSLDILNALLFQPMPTLPPADISWFMRSNPFSLLKSIVSLFNQRVMSSLIINKIDSIHVVLKKLIKILAEYISSLPNDHDQCGKFLLIFNIIPIQEILLIINITRFLDIHNSNTYLIRQF